MRLRPIGVSLTKVRGRILTVRNVDILAGTPLLDIKPYVAPFDAFKLTRSGRLDKAISMRAVADSRFEKKIP